jgi:hypothetical protein
MTRQTSRKNVSRKHTTRKTSRNTKKKRISKKKNSRKPKNVLIGGSRKMEAVFESLKNFKTLVTDYNDINMKPSESDTGEKKKIYMAQQKNAQSIVIKKIIEEIKKYPKPLLGFMPGSLEHLTEPRAKGQYSHIELCSDEFKANILLIVKAIEESLLKIHLHPNKPNYGQSPIPFSPDQMEPFVEIKYNDGAKEAKLGDIIQLSITGGKKYEIYIRLDDRFGKCKLNAKKVTKLEFDNVYLEGKDAVMYFTPEEEGNIIKVYGGIQNVKVPGGDSIEKGIVNTLFAITDEMMNKNTNPTATFIDDLHNLISKSKGKEDINQQKIATIKGLINNYTNLLESGDFYVLATKEPISGNHNNKAGAAAGPAREEAGPAREETGPARAATGGPNN